MLFFLGAAVGSTAVKKGLLGLRACLPLRLPCLVIGSVWVTLLDDGLVDGALGVLSRIGAACAACCSACSLCFSKACASRKSRVAALALSGPEVCSTEFGLTSVAAPFAHWLELLYASPQRYTVSAKVA